MDNSERSQLSKIIESSTPASRQNQPAIPQVADYSMTSCLERILYSGGMGVFLDVFILSVYEAAVSLGYHPGSMGLYYTLVEIPVITGILGFFFHKEMLDLIDEAAQKITSLR